MRCWDYGSTAMDNRWRTFPAATSIGRDAPHEPDITLPLVAAFARQRFGLTCYGEAAVIEKLAAAGFSATRLPANIGHNPARMTFLARPA
jgi:hypothetical protein